MAIRPFKRVAVTAATALSMTALLAGTAQAVPAVQQPEFVTYIVKQDGTTVKTANPRAAYTQPAQELSGPAKGVVMMAGKQTKPADPKLFKKLAGYNPFQVLPVEGDGPDADELDYSQGYSADKLFTLYHSDIPQNISYTDVISGYDAFMAKPAVKKANDELVIATNNNASLVQIRRAIEDSDDENLATMSDALGSNLGKIYRDLYNEGKLVKLQQLVGGNMSRAFNFSNATALEKVAYRNPRPFAVYPERIKYYYEDKDDAKTDDGYKGLIWSYPSGHTNRAYIKAIVLSAVFPEFAAQLLSRGSEVGYNRLVMGVHYPLDTVAGRMTASASMAWHFSDERFFPLIMEAARDTRSRVEKACGTTIMKCWAKGTPYLSEAESIRVYTARMNYNLPRVGKKGLPMEIPSTASSLLRVKFPQLTKAQRDRILLLSAMDSGYPLDLGGKAGYWQRVNLAEAMSAHVKMLGNGAIQVSFLA